MSCRRHLLGRFCGQMRHPRIDVDATTGMPWIAMELTRRRGPGKFRGAASGTMALFPRSLLILGRIEQLYSPLIFPTSGSWIAGNNAAKLMPFSYQDLATPDHQGCRPQ